MPGKKYKNALCWLRRDLRLNDNRALATATEQADKVTIIFVYDTEILKQLPSKSDRRVHFIQESIDEIDQTLSKNLQKNILTAIGNPNEIIPQLASEIKAEAVFCAHDDDPYSISRDKAVKSKLSADFISVKDHIVFERQEILSQSGQPYRVYTPYAKQWFAQSNQESFQEFIPDLSSITNPKSLIHAKVGNHTLAEIGFEKTNIGTTAGQNAAQTQLKDFAKQLHEYKAKRDFPDLQSTSSIGVHLRFGTISIRECFRTAMSNPSEGSHTWQKELVWREFYHMILANFPEVGQGQTFRPEYNNLEWPGTEEFFTKWCVGQTGYPIVDAAMRCLIQTGWMHNRLRMVTAMFLTKDLLVDWRKGEQHFADHLLDFELASNNGGWQWSSSTGADGQPYFRIFNPLLQSRKFDPEGNFIRKYCPELSHLDINEIHWPFNEDGTPNLNTPENYPLPIVNHKEQKPIVMNLFRSAPRTI